MTKVIETVQEMKLLRASLADSVAFVPTMGALHRGHEELLKKARAENKTVILSIFVNRTQFNDAKDFEKYPSTWESDLAMAQRNQVDCLFYPQYSEMYPDDYRYRVIENDFSRLLCGQDRPGHFDGVLSVVMKLFNIVSPQKAYFGEKDFQQLTLIKGMVESFFMDIEIVPVPTVRESDGLAMSSRNLRLSAEERAKAPAIYAAITQSRSAEEARGKLTAQGFRVDYVTDLDVAFGKRRFVAAHLGAVRLIDNVKI
jgi:pantoate--beta-alanine ligase